MIKLKDILNEDNKSSEDWFGNSYNVINQLKWDLNDLVQSAKRDRSIHRPNNTKSAAFKILTQIDKLVNEYDFYMKRNVKQGRPEPREPRSWDNEPG